MSKYKITLNGKAYELDVELLDGSAAVAAPAKAPTAAPKTQPAASAPKAAAPVAGGAGSVAAPMPGTILRVNKNVGDTVNAGESVVVLEAMKMENDINAPKAGKIKSIAVAQGQTVAAGELLFEVE